MLALASHQGFPLIFHGVMGKDEREANSPSFFNVTEIDVLVKYLIMLFETQGKKGLPKLPAKDIGIIAPYRKQVSGDDLCFFQDVNEKEFYPSLSCNRWRKSARP